MPTPSPLQRLLQRDILLLATVGMAILNGLPLTPLFDSVAYVLYLFTRGSSVIGRDLLYYLTSLFITAITMLVAGIPAALYERIRGLPGSTPISLGIWLVATVLLALPTLMHVTGLR